MKYLELMGMYTADQPQVKLWQCYKIAKNQLHKIP